MPAATRYLCSDDENNPLTLAHLHSITSQSKGQLSITLTEPIDFVSEVDRLKDEIQNQDYNGLLLDLRLDGPGSKAKYRATSLVQEIHTRAAEKRFPVCPLVLWSNDAKLKKSYFPDETSHDLFDLTIDKVKLTEESYATEIALKLIGLSNGYNQLRILKEKGVARAIEILKMPEGLSDSLDPRIIQPILQPGNSTYEQARFIHQQLLNTSNDALISSEILAARLGLSYRDTDKFESLATKLFPKAKYTGLFSEGWPCWWMLEVDTAWEALPKSPGPLRRLSAEKRVEFINSHLKAALVPCAPLEFNHSTYYWTICQITRKPLDPQEGYVVDRQLYPWQLTQYLSIFGKVNGGPRAKDWQVDPLELERFNEEKNLAIKRKKEEKLAS